VNKPIRRPTYKGEIPPKVDPDSLREIIMKYVKRFGAELVKIESSALTIIEEIMPENSTIRPIIKMEKFPFFSNEEKTPEKAMNLIITAVIKPSVIAIIVPTNKKRRPNNEFLSTNADMNIISRSIQVATPPILGSKPESDDARRSLPASTCLELIPVELDIYSLFISPLIINIPLFAKEWAKLKRATPITENNAIVLLGANSEIPSRRRIDP
jgi:hypothetical protein